LREQLYGYTEINKPILTKYKTIDHMKKLYKSG